MAPVGGRSGGGGSHLANALPPLYLSGMSKPTDAVRPATPAAPPSKDDAAARKPAQPDEKGGPAWPEPTRYGDWERGGRVSDF